MARIKNPITLIKGGTGTLISKNITQNGSYFARDDNADGYSQVNVNVQPSLTTKNITANGTYNAISDNADGYSQVVVNVAGGQTVDIPAPASITFNTGNYVLYWAQPGSYSGLALLDQYGYTISYQVVINNNLYTNLKIETNDTSLYVGEYLTGGINNFKVYVLIKTKNGVNYVEKIYDYTYELKRIGNIEESARNVCAVYSNNNGYIYLFGGSSGTGAYSNDIQLFNPSNNSIQTLNTVLPQALYGMGGACVGTDIYLFGGWNGNAKDVIYRFDTTSNNIYQLNVTLPKAMMGIVAASYGTKIYLFGGYETGGSLNSTIYEFDTTNNSFSILAAMLPIGSYDIAFAVKGDYVYLFGGYPSPYLDTILRFDFVSKTITTLSTTLPSKTYGAGAFTIGDHIYIFGGLPASSGNNSRSQVLDFDTTNDTIIVMTINLVTGVARFGISGKNNSIYIFGGMGTTSGDVTNYIQQFIDRSQS